METILQNHNTTNLQTLHMAMELSSKTWKLGFGNGRKERYFTITAGDWPCLLEQIKKAKEKLNLPEDCPVISCYEAGRDGFWIHRGLIDADINNLVIDSASIEVNRRKRQAKSDGVDVKALLRILYRYASGETSVVSVLRVPDADIEDGYRVTRERKRLIKERGAHSARISSLLVLHGIKLKLNKDFIENLKTIKAGVSGYLLGGYLKAELTREYKRYSLANEQIKALEKEQQQRTKEAKTKTELMIVALVMLRGIGQVSSWTLAVEFFWRDFRNGKQVGACAGLTPTPYSSGDSEREQGISKAGNKNIRSLMVELSWLWLRYQPDSDLSQWFEKRYAHGGKRMRRIGIVAMARKLLVALWRYVNDGVIPAGAIIE